MKLYNWVKCLDGDLRYVRKSVKFDQLELSSDLDKWLTLYDQYLQRFGFNEKYLKVLKLLKNIAILELKWVLTRDNFIETKLSIEREKLNSINRKKQNRISIERSLVYIGKWYGSHIKINEITVAEYEELTKAYIEANKEVRQEKNNRKSK